MDPYVWPESVVRHVRHASRALTKMPAFTATVILTMALGIGANSAVFSAINAVLLRPLPFPRADQLVQLAQSGSRIQPFVAPVRLKEWNRLNDTFQVITGYYLQDDSELSGDLPEKLQRAFVAPGFLQVWGIAPTLGRDFSPLEERFGGPPAVLISERLWRRRFGGTPDAIGKALRLGQASLPIVGVMPASFLFPVRGVDVWSPSPMDTPYAQGRQLTWFTGIGRLKPGVTLAQARANLSTVQANLGVQYPNTDAAIRPDVQPLKDITVGGVRRSLWLLFGSVSLLLLIACTNIAALLLSRAAGREHEVAVRFALGATRTSVVMELLTEVLLLAMGGALLGLLVAAGASGVFRALAGTLPRLDEIRLDWRIVVYSLACAIAATILSGLIPMLRATRRGLAGSLATAGRSLVSGRHSIQFALVGVQVALAVTLLIGAGLLLRSFRELGRVSPGFEIEHVLTFHLSTSWAEANGERARQRTKNVMEALSAVPGVEAAATSFSLPGVPTEYQVELSPVEGRAETEPRMLAHARPVTPSYFATLRIPLLAGEVCREEPGTRSMMVNKSFANAYFPGSSAIGRRLTLPAVPSVMPNEIRGIVGDARETGLDREPVPTVYWCGGANQPGTFFLVRTHAEPRAMADTIRRTVHDVEPQRSVYDLVPLADQLSDAYAENR